MSAESYEVRTLNIKHSGDLELLRAFLETEGLVPDRDLDYAVVLMDEEKIVASGCAAGNILKCIAVHRDYQGHALTNRIMTLLRLRAYHEQYEKLFLYTKPENESVFTDLGFTLIAQAPEAVLMENTEKGCEDWVETLERPEGNPPSAALVMNCNPFTLGHRYLIEKACAENETVHLFVVREDLSVFPFKVRMELIRKGCEDLENLFIHEGRDYIISRATFPSYFIKEEKIMDDSHTRLDLSLFARKIAPGLNIRKRYVGEEPFDVVTSRYNTLMKEILPGAGIEVAEIPRREIGGRAVSATRIREALAAGTLEEIRDQVPSTTYEYLISEKGSRIGKKIREKMQ
jgi:[citrate (pro-3S)-lyase] ligase